MSSALTYRSPENPSPDGLNGKVAFCTVLTDSFLPGFAVLLHTLKEHHAGFDYPFVIFYHDELATLSAESRDLARQLYPKVQFQHVDASHYSVVWSNRDGILNTPERLKAAFFTLECFNLIGYEKVIFLDADMMCMGNLNALMSMETDLGAVAAYDYDKGGEAGHYNSGLIVAGRRHLTGETYSALLKHNISAEYEIRKGKADQAILNDFFGIEEIERIDECFNTTKRKFPDSKIQAIGDVFASGVRLLHFVGEKPWQFHSAPREDQYTILEQYWASQLERAMPFGMLLAHTRLLQARSDSFKSRIATSAGCLPKSRAVNHESRASASAGGKAVANGRIPQDGSVAFATAVNDAFVPGLECLLFSIRRQHPEFAAPFHIFHDDRLSVENRDYLRSIYALFQFHFVDKAPYSGFLPALPDLATRFYIFEAFRIPGSATIVTLPADLLCLGNFSQLCKSPKRLAVAWNGNRLGLPVAGANKDNFSANSAVMVLPPRIRNHTAFQNVLQHVGKLMTEEPTGKFSAETCNSDRMHPDSISKIRFAYNASIKLIHSNPNFDPFAAVFLHFSGDKPWNVDPEKDVPKSRRPLHRTWHRIHGLARNLHRRSYYRTSGALDELLELRNRHRGKRAFIVGDGDSLAKLDLTKLNGEIVFVGDRFALRKEAIHFTPTYYSLCAPEIFGGWSETAAKIDENLQTALLEKTAKIPKFLPFFFRPYVESRQILPGHKVRYLLLEPPLKRYVDSVGLYNLDPAISLHDGRSVVITFQFFLAHLMGIREIYLLGCDLAEDAEAPPPGTSSSRNRKEKAFQIANNALEAKGVLVRNATRGGNLDIFPCTDYLSLFSP